MEIKLQIKENENIANLSEADMAQIREIFSALISSGSLTGVKSGQTIIHFNQYGQFTRIQLSYFPWQKRGESTPG